MKLMVLLANFLGSGKKERKERGMGDISSNIKVCRKTTRYRKQLSSEFLLSLITPAHPIKEMISTCWSSLPFLILFPFPVCVI